MKVLVLPSWYPSKSYPNNGIFFKEQAEALKNSGLDVTVLCIEIPYRKTKKDFSYFKQNSYEENGIQVYRYVFPFGVLHRFPKQYYKFLRIIARYIYKKEFQKQKYDIIHAHSFLIGGYVGTCIKEISNCKCIITEHTSKILVGQLNDVEREILTKCVQESDAFVCVSQNLKNYVQRITNTKKKIYVYPNLVHPLFYYKTKPQAPFLFASVGNLIPLKRMDLLIGAFCKAFTKDENIKLKIFGSGSECENLKKIISKKERQGQIILCGAVSRQEIAENLRKSHVMALLSENETFGVAYVEALACGNIVVGANNGGANDIIQGNNGVIIPSAEIEEIAKILRNIYEAYSEYNPHEISKKCIGKYGAKAFGENYRKLFEMVIKGCQKDM